MKKNKLHESLSAQTLKFKIEVLEVKTKDRNCSYPFWKDIFYI